MLFSEIFEFGAIFGSSIVFFSLVEESLGFLSSFAWILWLRIVGLESSVWVSWLEIFGLGSSLWDLWFWIFGLGSFVRGTAWDLLLGEPLGAAQGNLGPTEREPRIKTLYKNPLGKPS